LFFYLATLLSVYCSSCAAYLLAMHTRSAAACSLVFGGVLLPLELLTSGYLVLVPTISPWYVRLRCQC
jgi:hypothetical protein